MRINLVSFDREILTESKKMKRERNLGDNHGNANLVISRMSTSFWPTLKSNRQRVALLYILCSGTQHTALC